MYVSIHTVYNFMQALLSLHGQAEYFGQKSASLSDFLRTKISKFMVIMRIVLNLRSSWDHEWLRCTMVFLERMLVWLRTQRPLFSVLDKLQTTLFWMQVRF